MNKQQQIEIEAATFRKLLAHLDAHKNVQNIDLMNLAGFCRNCLAKWYQAEAEQQGLTLDYEVAREIIYGMPYQEWKKSFQTAASAEQLSAFAAAQTHKDSP